MAKRILILAIISILVLFFNLPQNSSAQPKSDPVKYVPGELLIKFKENKIPHDEQFNGQKIEPIFKNHQNDELGYYYKIKLPPDADLAKTQAGFEKSSKVEKISLNYLAQAAYTPNDPKYTDATQWGLTKINMGSAWDYTTGSSSVIIANIDSGVDTDHEEIDGKIWVNAADPVDGLDNDSNGLIDDWRGWDYIANVGYASYGPPLWPPGCFDRDPGDPNRTADNDPNPELSGLDEDFCLYPGVDNGVNHGTYTAGIAAANTNNALGIAGVCPNCKIMALRVLDDEGWGAEADIAAAITYAGDKGADVISMSLAGPYDETVIAAAVHHSYEAGSVLVAAAGNGDAYGVGYDIDPPAYKLSPICNDNYDYLDGGDNQVIGVAATNSSDVKTTFSNYGLKYVDAAAPGQSIYSLANANGYASGSGTSASTPFVAGVAGLLKSLYPTWDNKAIRDATIDLITNINSLNPSYWGKIGGRLNAERALDPSERFNGSGTVIKGADYPNIYLLQNGQKRHILNPEVFNSFYRSWGYYANISFPRLDEYPNGPDLIFRQGTLIRASGYPEVYQIEYPSAIKRHITSSSVFTGLGYSWDDVIETSLAVVNSHATGSDIAATGSHVAGALIKTSSAPEIYLLDMEAGVKTKRHIINPQIFELYFRWQDVALIDDLEMSSYPGGSDYRFQDGALLKGTGPEIYLISYGKKRHFISPDAYLSRGHNFNQYISVLDLELTNYAAGEDLN